MWEPYKKGFKAWLQLEKSLADNSVEAYLRDIEKLTDYLQAAKKMKAPEEVELKDLEKFVQWINELGMTASSQSRIISGLWSCFFAGLHTTTLRLQHRSVNSFKTKCSTLESWWMLKGFNQQANLWRK